MPKIARIERAIFPNGKAVLAAYGVDDQFLIGIVCRPRSSLVEWAKRPVTSRDRKRLQQEIKTLYKE